LAWWKGGMCVSGVFFFLLFTWFDLTFCGLRFLLLCAREWASGCACLVCGLLACLFACLLLVEPVEFRLCVWPKGRGEGDVIYFFGSMRWDESERLDDAICKCLLDANEFGNLPMDGWR
jgi:hypothetical protein